MEKIRLPGPSLAQMIVHTCRSSFVKLMAILLRTTPAVTLNGRNCKWALRWLNLKNPDSM
jgi:hypothetical protein